MPGDGHILVFGQREHAADEVALAGGRLSLVCAVAPSREGPNQDALGVLPVGDGAGVVVVADGAGGMPDGDRAARIAVEAIASRLEGIDPDEPVLRAAILDGIEDANRTIVEERSGAASTLEVLEIRDGTVRAYHIGDSSTLVVGGRGKLKYQTVPHSPVGYAVEAGLVERQEALFHEDLHLVSNLLGTPEMHIEMGPLLPLAPRDTVLVSSDGLTDNLHRDEIAGIIRKGPLADASKRLAALAAARMGDGDGSDPSKEDDLTVVLFRLAR